MIKRLINKKAIGLVIITTSFSFFYACKEKTITGTDTIPDEDRINTVKYDEQFFEPEFYVGKIDSAFTNNMAQPQVALGETQGDNIFSSIKASAYLQLAPAGAFYSVPQGYQLDSAHLVLPFSGTMYGDSLNFQETAMHIKLYNVKEGIKNTKLYYQDASFPLDQELVNATFGINTLKQEYILGTDTIKNALVLKLPNSYIQSVLDLPAQEYESTGIFLESINGFYIEAQRVDNQSKGAIYYFDLNGKDINKKARIQVHGRDAEDKEKALHFAFSLGNTNYINHIEKQNNTNFAYLYDGNKHATDSVFVETVPGLYTDIVLKNLRDLPASIIHTASISLVNIPQTQIEYFAMPPQLIVERVRIKDGVEEIEKLEDYGKFSGLYPSSGLQFVGGQLGLKSLLGQTHGAYKLHFPRTLQKAIKEGEEELILRVRPIEETVAGYRALMGGKNQSDEKYNMKIEVVATKLD